jgi:hypothetical protein
VACAPRRATLQGPPTESHTVGVYKGRIEPVEGKARRFRLLLFAAFPDRIHGEVLSPLGAPQLIVDGGGGRLAVTFVRDRESFAGPARGDVMDRILGVRLELDEWVRALLTGEAAGDEHHLERIGPETGELPEALTIRSEGGTLTLVLKRLRPLRADPTLLGTGRPPEGMRVRPLEDLDGEGERLERLAGDEAES